MASIFFKVVTINEIRKLIVIYIYLEEKKKQKLVFKKNIC